MLGSFLDVRVADAIDILVATVLLYTAIAWIRRTQAAQVAVGILILGLGYLVVRLLDLQLTAWLFQGFFAIFVIVLVVLFQEEFRQLFERVAVLSLRRRHPLPPSQGPTDILVQCLSDFARDRTGALLVIPGKQPIARHIQGGIELGGKVSLPLLKSLFDPHSPGHDGAVILEDGRISRFAAHLPLSKDFRQLAGLGTRHSAALGLAELSDALCLVVSEERGRVSVAQNTRLRVLQDPQELGPVLEGFFAARLPAPRHRYGVGRFLRENLVDKAISLILVIGLWYLLIPGSRPAQVKYSVPVKVINLPAEYMLDGISPDKVQATFAGPRHAFYLFDPRRLEVTIDASRAKRGRQTFEISSESLPHPAALSLEELSPSTVKISVRKAPAGPAAGQPPQGRSE